MFATGLVVVCSLTSFKMLIWLFSRLLILWNTHSPPFTAVTGTLHVCAMCGYISLLSSRSTHNKAPLFALQIEINEADVYLELESSLLLFIYHLGFDHDSSIQVCLIWDNDVKLWHFHNRHKSGTLLKYTRSCALDCWHNWHIQWPVFDLRLLLVIKWTQSVQAIYRDTLKTALKQLHEFKGGLA